MEVKEYYVVYDNNINKVQTDVNTMIKSGWQPLGALVITEDQHSEESWYYQTMVK